MKRCLLLVIFYLLSTPASYAETFAIGNQDAVHSSILDQQREFTVYLPPSYYTAADREFPVLYILDGAYNFRYVSGLLELEGAISERTPQMILVAISGDGSKTYSENSKPAIEGVEDSGNAGEVAEFIAKELIPYVDANYRTGDFRILSGHSIGGLFVINTALNHPQLFDRYIAISPALWWQGNAINQVAEQKVDGDFDTKVYISLGQQRNMGVDSFLAVATGSVLKHPGFIVGLVVVGIFIAVVWGIRRKKILWPVVLVIVTCACAAYLQLLYYPQDSNFTFQRFPAENHNSVGEPTYRWALEDIFSAWRTDPPYFTSTADFVAHYRKVEAAYGSTFNIPSSVLRYTRYYMPKENPGELEKFEAKLKAEYPNAHVRLKLIEARQLLEEDPAASGQLLDQILQSDPDSFVAMNLVARRELQQGRPVEAGQWVTKALEQARQQHARRWQVNQLLETRAMIKAAGVSNGAE